VGAVLVGVNEAIKPTPKEAGDAPPDAEQGHL
jgi:hypothetical protein